MLFISKLDKIKVELSTSARAYIWAVVGTAVAVVIRLLLWDVVGDRAPYAFFFIVVTFAGILGGSRPALLATILGGAAGHYFIVLPRMGISLNIPDLISLCAFLFVGTIISLLCGTMRQREMQVAGILNTALDAVVVTDENGVIRFWNRQAELIFGWTKNEVNGQQVENLIFPENYREAHRDAMKQLMTNGEASNLNSRVETTGRAKDGATFPIELAMTAQQINSAWTFTSFINDITVRREAEESLRRVHSLLESRVEERTAALRNQENFLRTIIDTVADPIFVKDRDHRWIEGNKAFWDLIGSEAKMKGKTDYDLFPKEQADHFWEGDERVFNGEMFNEEERLRNAEGEDITIATKKVPFELAGGRLGIVGVIRDVTREKKVEEELRHHRDHLQELVTLQTQDLTLSKERAEAANVAKTEFLTNMSHEIRTPMNVIMGIAEILMLSQPLTEKQRGFIGILQTSSHSLLALINDLLDITKIEARKLDLEMQPFNLAAVVLEVHSMLAVSLKEKNLTFGFDVAAVEEKIFVGDGTRLQQMIVNLCSNAIKFTSSGGIHIGIACTPGQHENQQLVSISVTDTGIGIAPDKQSVIFEKFIQADSSISRKYGGTGLGLTITKTLAEAMGGKIDLKSQPGKGSTFTLHIPLALPTTAADVQQNSPAESQLAVHKQDCNRILIVEDHVPNRIVAEAYLEHLGYAYESVNNGQDAVEKIKTYNYGAVLMDVQMPDLNGYEATARIRAWEQEQGKIPVPIIGMTAHALLGDKERCLAAGMTDYISKPIDPEKFATMMQSYSQENLVS